MSNYVPTPPPRFATGHQFTNKDGKKHLITYSYNTGTQWKYHVGLIVHPNDYKYFNVTSRQMILGMMVVDYCTATEEEIDDCTAPS